MGGAVIDLEDFDGAVFDLDGVVTDTARIHAAAWRELFDEFLRDAAPCEPPFDPEKDYVNYVDGRARVDGVAGFLASRHIDLPRGRDDDLPTARTMCGLGHRKDEIFLARLSRMGVRVFPGTVAVLGRMRAAGMALAVVSASRNCRAVLDAGKVTDLFDVVVDGVIAGEERLPGKPDPATFLFAARRLGIAPARAVLVEDALAGIEAGRRGHFGLVVGVDRHHSEDDLRQAGADVVVRDVSELRLSDRTGPDPAADGWVITRDIDSELSNARSQEVLFALSDGAVGIRGDVERGSPPGPWLTLAAGAYGIGREGDATVRLLPGPSLAPIARAVSSPSDRWTLDLRSGTVSRRPKASSDGVRSVRFVSLARPGLIVLRGEADPEVEWTEQVLTAPGLEADAGQAAGFAYREGTLPDDGCWAETRSDRARVVAVARQRTSSSPRGSSSERVIAVRSGDNARRDAELALSEAWSEDFPTLLREHSREWASRWDGSQIEIEGDPASQEAIRFALFHLLSCAPLNGDAAVGARGLTGLAYSGHVFWDADVFVLPALAAVLPAAARAMLEYRVRRLEAARRQARARGRSGARFPWESADSGEDVTPISVRDRTGQVVPILTGRHEEHLSSDVAWAAVRYVDWTGDTEFLNQTGRTLVEDTARYWASRIRTASDGRAHLFGLMGPDEYHELVDDNAFTNVLVRWHLRRAAELVGPATDEGASWMRLADALVDGYDAATCRHEQFAGFWRLEPMRISDMSNVPIAADVLLGTLRVSQAQVLKQPDVLMVHHMLPDESPAGSLAADLDYYLPRTAHGSSLSPAICASLLARSGRPDEAMALFDIGARIDLDDISATAGGGLHLAAFGALWQAVVYGFAGVHAANDALHIRPALPSRWTRLRVRLQYRGVGVRVEITADRVVVETSGSVRLVVNGAALNGSGVVVRIGGEWRVE